MRYLTKLVTVPEGKARPTFSSAFQSVTPQEDFCKQKADYECKWCDGFSEGRTKKCTPAHLVRHIALKHSELNRNRTK
jgi:hypothetical protein